MLLKILRFFIGYLKVEVNGFAPERFMNLIITNDVVVWDVTTTDKGYIFLTGRKNLLKMKPLLQKTNVKLSILEKHGFPYFIKKKKRRVFFLLGFFFCILFIYAMSLFIWEVKVVGEDRLIAKELLKRIEKDYVPLGSRIKEIDCNELEENIRRDYEEISWISCSIQGTTLMVFLEEGTENEQENPQYETCDIVASKDAVITKMITREGTPVAKVKDTVKKGEILISGTIYIYDDNNEVLETNYIAADGDIIGETTTEYNEEINRIYYEKQYSQSNKKYITLFFMNYFLTPLKPDIPYENTDVSTQVHKIKIFSDFYLPVGIKITEIKPYKVIKRTHTEKEMNDILKQRFQKKKDDFKAKGVEIIENNVKIEKTEDGMIASGNLILRESIGISCKSVPIQETNKQDE